MDKKERKAAIRRHAAEGAKALDTKYPDWYKHINLDTLDMDSAFFDLDEQLWDNYPGYASEEGRFGSMYKYNDLPRDLQGQHPESLKMYKVLTKAYRKEVKARMAADTRVEGEPQAQAPAQAKEGPREVPKPPGATDPLGDGKSWCLVTTTGADMGIAQRARTSHATNTPSSTDESLLRHLMRHRHSSPIEFAEVEVYCKLPISVARHMVRHRTASISEASARYCELPGDYYLPSLARMMTQSSESKQGSGEPLAPEVAHNAREALRLACEEGLDGYHACLDLGLARETARGCLSVNTYTVWYFKLDLRNALHFLSLRDDPHTQWETRQYAKAIADVVRRDFPILYQAYEDYVKNAISLTGPDIRVLTYLENVCGGSWPISTVGWQDVFKQVDFPANKRERRECVAKLKKITGRE